MIPRTEVPRIPLIRSKINWNTLISKMHLEHQDDATQQNRLCYKKWNFPGNHASDWCGANRYFNYFQSYRAKNPKKVQYISELISEMRLPAVL